MLRYFRNPSHLGMSQNLGPKKLLILYEFTNEYFTIVLALCTSWDFEIPPENVDFSIETNGFEGPQFSVHQLE